MLKWGILGCEISACQNQVYLFILPLETEMVAIDGLFAPQPPVHSNSAMLVSAYSDWGRGFDPRPSHTKD